MIGSHTHREGQTAEHILRPRTHSTPQNTSYASEHIHVWERLLCLSTVSMPQNTFCATEHTPRLRTRSVSENTFCAAEHILCDRTHSMPKKTFYAHSMPQKTFYAAEHIPYLREHILCHRTHSVPQNTCYFFSSTCPASPSIVSERRALCRVSSCSDTVFSTATLGAVSLGPGSGRG